MKIMFIYEHYYPPFDEGVKKFACMVYHEMLEDSNLFLLRDLGFLPGGINRLLLIPRIFLRYLFLCPDRVIYIPQASLTFFSYIRIWILESVLRGKFSVIGVQRRSLSRWQQKIISLINFNKVFVLSSAMAKEVNRLGIHAKIINIGIDRIKYSPVDDTQNLRKKYVIPVDRKVLLHVGHIRESRNIRWLLEIQRALPDIQVLLVGSTATQQDDTLCQDLVRVGAIVLRDYIPDIQEIYQLADWYCFPVLNDDGAMETPLSILEAMAVNLPIITTRFGRLPELFRDDGCYRYVDSNEDIIKLLRTGFGQECHNRQKTEPYTWRATVETLLRD